MGTRAGQRRKTKRAVGSRLNRAFPESKASLQKRLDGYRARARKARGQHKNPKAPQALGMGAHGGAVVVAGGGGIAGVVGETMPDVFGIDSRLIAGVALTVWGGASSAKAAQIGACLGAGMLACVAQDLTAGLVSGQGLDLGVIGIEQELAATGTE